MTLEAGEVLVDKYRVEGLLGRGGMGAVYRATNIDSGQPVALKVLLAGMQSDARAIAARRLEREARVMA